MIPSGAKATMNVKCPDIELLPGEHSDIRIDVRLLLSNADEWLATPNTDLGGRAPNELIGSTEESKVREMLRAALYSSMA